MFFFDIFNQRYGFMFFWGGRSVKLKTKKKGFISFYFCWFLVGIFCISHIGILSGIGFEMWWMCDFWWLLRIFGRKILWLHHKMCRFGGGESLLVQLFRIELLCQEKGGVWWCQLFRIVRRYSILNYGQLVVGCWLLRGQFVWWSDHRLRGCVLTLVLVRRCAVVCELWYTHLVFLVGFY